MTAISRGARTVRYEQVEERYKELVDKHVLDDFPDIDHPALLFPSGNDSKYCALGALEVSIIT